MGLKISPEFYLTVKYFTNPLCQGIKIYYFKILFESIFELVTEIFFSKKTNFF